MNQPVNCLASRGMTPVIEWRNDNTTPLKKGVAAVAFFGLNTLALIETVAYAALKIISRLFSCCWRQPYDLFSNLLSSSIFTFAWGSFNLLIGNWVEAHLFPDEINARMYAAGFLQARNLNHAAPAAPAAPPVGPALTRVQQGSHFIVDHVVQGMDAGTRDLFMQVDPDVVSLVAAKTVFVYTLGALRNAPVPIFLQRATRDQIVALRAQFGAAAPSNALRTLFNSQVAYAAGLVAEHADRPKFQAIVAASGSELQGSEFLTQGWGGAIALMP